MGLQPEGKAVTVSTPSFAGQRRLDAIGELAACNQSSHSNKDLHMCSCDPHALH